MVTREQVVAEARSWVGVPFRHMGRGRAEGVDCVGLVVCVASALGLPVDDYPVNYTRRGQGFDLVRHSARQGSQIKLKDARDGDVVVFNESMIPCHVGFIFTRDGQRYIVQALGRTSYMRVVETPWAGEWEGKARYAFQMPGLED